MREQYSSRPVLKGTRGMVAAGHYLGAEIGLSILEKGGNAVDAAVAAGFICSLVEPHLNGIGGELSMLVYQTTDNSVYAVNGHGQAPERASVDFFKENDYDYIPERGFLPATVPGAFGGWCEALKQFGTLSLQAVLSPAIEIAKSGYVNYDSLYRSLKSSRRRFCEEWETSRETFLTNGEVPDRDDIIKNPEWAATFKGAVEAELNRKHHGREEGIQAAMDYFYRGPIAKQILMFQEEFKVRDETGQAHSGWFSKEDFERYEPSVESPISISWNGLEVYKCSSWCQGPVFLQQLRLLENFDLQEMGHNSTDYIHTVLECSKRAFMDREGYYGDPEAEDVPLDTLLDSDYAKKRAEDIEMESVGVEVRPGEIDGYDPVVPWQDQKVEDLSEWVSYLPVESRDEKASPPGGDTTHIDVIDAYGNMVSVTPSGGWLASSPVVRGLGFPLGTRGQIFNLVDGHPNQLQPGKRPRSTLTPSMALKDNKPFIAFGTPGGDCQDQWTLQFFLNYILFDMDLQEALDAPSFHSVHFPGSFSPHKHSPHGVLVEDRVSEKVLDELTERGHRIQPTGGWQNGRCSAAVFDIDRGVIKAACSPRRETGYVMGW